MASGTGVALLDRLVVLTRAITSLVFLTVASPGFAREVTLQDVLELARVEAPRLVAARHQIEVTQARRQQAGVAPIHNPELEASWSDDWLFNADGERSVSVGLSQELEIAGQPGLRERVADLDVERARADVAAFERELQVQAAERFYGLLGAQERLAIAQELWTLSQSLLEVTERRFAAGDTPEIERNLIAAAVAAAAGRVAAAEGEVAAEGARLGALLGQPVGSGWVARGDWPSADETELLGLAADRLDIVALSREAERESATAELLEREAAPNLTLTLAWERERSVVSPDDFGNSALGAELGGIDDTSDRLMVALGLPIPLFNRNQGSVAEAQALETAANLRAEALQREAAGELDAARAELEAARQRLLLAEQVLPQLDRNLELLLSAYEGGYIDAASLLTARDRVISARVEHLEAANDHADARLALLRALGVDPAPFLEVAP